VFSTLFPNSAQPNHGVFVENRLRHTLALGGLQATVVAPVTYFPFSHPMFGRYAAHARTPRHERRHGLDVWHPRYVLAPKLGERMAPATLYRAALAEVRRLQKAGMAFDVIDAHYFYPDGVVAARLGRTLDLPVVITGRGTDLTLIPNSPASRAKIQQAAAEASAMVGVCEDLRLRMVELGADPARTITLRNGVDLEQFKPVDREAARRALGVEGFTLVSVGSLIPRKGHDLTIRALRDAPDCRLLIAGGGPLRGELEALAAELGLGDRVRLLGDMPHSELSRLYSAADVSVLASSREGWANVLLESMACGTPVVATDVNGTAEVVRAPEAGRLVPERSAAAIAREIAELRRAMPDRAATRAYAEQFGWLQIARANKALLTAVAQAGRAGRGSPKAVEAAKFALQMSAESPDSACMGQT
jgi:glycosyltransferase involved in cell wall biosynthesis